MKRKRFHCKKLDYDIDKAYIMGQEFGQNGKMVKFSDLFSYDTVGELKASLTLPTPRGLFVTANEDGDGLDIDNHLDQLREVYGKDDERRIRLEAKLLIDIYNHVDRNDVSKKSINLLYGGENEDIAEKVIRDLKTHESTRISAFMEEAAYKNSVSSAIQNVVQDLDNMVMAYQPVSMDNLRGLANDSEKGHLVMGMSMMNPLTKYSMQVQNMTGKNVIGIAAVGEKVFYNLSYYYNEGIRTNDERWTRNLNFRKVFNRIQNRYDASRGNGEIRRSVKTFLANVNFGNYREIARQVVDDSQIIDILRQEMPYATDEQLTRRYGEIRSSEREMNAYALRALESRPVDLFISELLSAATD